MSTVLPLLRLRDYTFLNENLGHEEKGKVYYWIALWEILECLWIETKSLHQIEPVLF